MKKGQHSNESNIICGVWCLCSGGREQEEGEEEEEEEVIGLGVARSSWIPLPCEGRMGQ